jgi:hypothetical protein
VRLDLRLHSRTASGQPSRADVSVYTKGGHELQKEADLAARTAAWVSAEAPFDPIPDGSQITVERVERI